MNYDSYYNGYYQPRNPYYQPAMPDMLAQYKQTQQPIQPQPQEPIIWVQGEAGAKAYMVSANSTVVLWDTENSTIYIKSADASGMPSMRILDFVERTGTQKPHECKCANTYKNDIEILKNDVAELKQTIEDMKAKGDSI